MLQSFRITRYINILCSVFTSFLKNACTWLCMVFNNYENISLFQKFSWPLLTTVYCELFQHLALNFYTFAEISRFESSGKTILCWHVLTRITRKFRGLHCVQIYRLTPPPPRAVVPIEVNASNSSVNCDRSQATD